MTVGPFVWVLQRDSALPHSTQKPSPFSGSVGERLRVTQSAYSYVNRRTSVPMRTDPASRSQTSQSCVDFGSNADLKERRKAPIIFLQELCILKACGMLFQAQDSFYTTLDMLELLLSKAYKVFALHKDKLNISSV